MAQEMSTEAIVNDFYSLHPKYRTKKKLIEMLTLPEASRWTHKKYGVSVSLKIDNKTELGKLVKKFLKERKIKRSTFYGKTIRELLQAPN
jgi:hypothetical protein